MGGFSAPVFDSRTHFNRATPPRKTTYDGVPMAHWLDRLRGIPAVLYLGGARLESGPALPGHARSLGAFSNCWRLTRIAEFSGPKRRTAGGCGEWISRNNLTDEMLPAVRAAPSRKSTANTIARGRHGRFLGRAESLPSSRTNVQSLQGHSARANAPR